MGVAARAAAASEAAATGAAAMGAAAAVAGSCSLAAPAPGGRIRSRCLYTPFSDYDGPICTACTLRGNLGSSSWSMCSNLRLGYSTDPCSPRVGTRAGSYSSRSPAACDRRQHRCQRMFCSATLTTCTAGTFHPSGRNNRSTCSRWHSDPRTSTAQGAATDMPAVRARAEALQGRTTSAHHSSNIRFPFHDLCGSGHPGPICAGICNHWGR